MAGRPDLAVRAFGLDDGGDEADGGDLDDEAAAPAAPDDLMVEEGDVRDGHEPEMTEDSDTVAANGGSHTVDDEDAVRMDDAGPDRMSTKGPDSTPAEDPDGASTDRPVGRPEVADE